MVFNTIESLLKHEDSCHAVWVCELCDWVFRGKRHAVEHFEKRHTDISSEPKIKRFWTLEIPDKREHRIEDRSSLVTLFHPVEEYQSFPDHDFHPQDFEETTETSTPKGCAANDGIIAYISAQISSLTSLLSNPGFTVDEDSRRRLDSDVDALHTRIRANAGAWNANFHISGISHGRKTHTADTADATSPLGNGPPHSASTTSLSRPGSGADAQQAREPAGGGGGGGAEPMQATHVPAAAQQQHYTQMQACCVAAAFTFYTRHRPALDAAADRRGRRLCATPAGRAITAADELTLPQWTHLLRRLADARALPRAAVARLESFCGEIQPVDEVRHAAAKRKRKSDRDLLALVQAARVFCWQLRDWPRCEQLDELYAAIEEDIALRRADAARGERPPYLRGMGTCASNTWPRLVAAAAEED